MCKSSYTLISFILLLHVDLNLLAHARVYLHAMFGALASFADKNKNSPYSWCSCFN